MAGTDDRDGPATPIEGSGTYPALRDGAESLAALLRRERPGSLKAESLAAQLVAIAALMRSWSPRDRPTKEDRDRLIDELVAATKEAYGELGRFSSAPPG